MTPQRCDPTLSPQELSRAVVQAAQQLGLVRAEVGRILGYKCAQFSALYEGSGRLAPGSEAWRKGALLVGLFHLLQRRFGANRAQMVHWLRRHNPQLGDAPFYLMVDQGRLAEVVDYLVATSGRQ